MRYLSFNEFVNESIRLNEAYTTPVDPKVRKAADLIAAFINKKTSMGFVAIPYDNIYMIDGNESMGCMFVSDKGRFPAIRVAANSNVNQPGIVGQLEFYEELGDDVAKYIFSSDNFPIVQLVTEAARIIGDSKYAAQVQAALNESAINESSKLTSEDIKAISRKLNAGEAATQIAKELGVPYYMILKVRNGVAVAEKDSPMVKKNEQTLDDKVKFFEETMEDIYDISRKVGAGAFNSLFISGRAGTGKTYNVERALKDEGLEEDEDYMLISGAVSVIMMYKKMYQFRNKTLIFDDCDAVFRDENGRNILKAALDTKKVRRISYLKKSSLVFDPKDYENDPQGEYEQIENGLVPAYFEFAGRVIFISNLEKDKADPDGAIRSRSYLIDVDPDDATLMERMRLLLPHLEPKEMPLSEKEEIFDFMQQANDISMRTFVKAAGLKSAGLKNWKRMAQRHL
jgi:hypothetical protein